MTAGHGIQIVIAALTAAAVVIAAFGILREKKQAREAIAAQAVAAQRERIIECCRGIAAQLDLFSAEILPFWKDPETMKVHAGVQAEVSVHRHLEQLRSGVTLLSSTVEMDEMGGGRPSARELLQAGALLRSATFMLYFALVAHDPRDVCVSSFLGELDGPARAVGEQWVADASSEEAANLAAYLIDRSRANLFGKLSVYVRDLG